jgi:hypothetical protein
MVVFTPWNTRTERLQSQLQHYDFGTFHAKLEANSSDIDKHSTETREMHRKDIADLKTTILDLENLTKLSQLSLIRSSTDGDMCILRCIICILGVI